MSRNPATIGVVLAGGRSRRMGGGDKPLKRIGGRAILDRVIERFSQQCDGLVLNANGDPARFSRFGLPVAADGLDDFQGPLAGVLAALDWAAVNRPDADWVVSAAGDSPFLPRDLVARLHQVRDARDADLAVAESGGRMHPVFGLWRVDLRGVLRHALVAEGVRKVSLWTERHRLAVASWPADPVDPFFNANTPADLAEAERLATFLTD